MFLLCWISDQHLGRPPEPGPLLIMGHRYIWAGPLSHWWTQTQSRETHKPTGESTEGQQCPFGDGTWWTDGSNPGLMNELCKPLHLSRHDWLTNRMETGGDELFGEDWCSSGENITASDRLMTVCVNEPLPLFPLTSSETRQPDETSFLWWHTPLLVAKLWLTVTSGLMEFLRSVTHTYLNTEKQLASQQLLSAAAHWL